MISAMPKPRSVQATLRFRSVVLRQLWMAGSMSGLTPVVSMNQAAPSSQRLSTLCTNGIRNRRSAMCTYRMCGMQQRMSNIGGMDPTSGILSGLPEVGHCKNYLLQK